MTNNIEETQGMSVAPAYYEVYDEIPIVVLSVNILNSIRRGEQVNLNNVIIKNDIDLTRLNTLQTDGRILINTSIIITNSQILGDINFSNALFLHAIDLRGSIVCGETSFEKSMFVQPCHFNKAHFLKKVNLNLTVFYERAAVDFSNAEFKYTECMGARFPRSASFNECIFTGDILFNGTTFTGISNFSGTTFLGNQTQSIWFRGTKFCKEAYFKDARFMHHAEFIEAEFRKG